MYPKGFDAGFGWVGLMPDGTWQRFPTDKEYLEEFRKKTEAPDQSEDS